MEHKKIAVNLFHNDFFICYCQTIFLANARL